MKWFEFRKDNVKIWLTVILVAGLIGFLYTEVVYFRTPNEASSRWVGVIIGLCVGATSAGFELFFVSAPFSPMRKLSFLSALFVRVVVHLSLIFFSMLVVQIIYDQIYNTGILMFDPVRGGVSTDLTFSFAVMFIVIFYMQMRLFIGPRTLKNLILGKYNQPLSEERIFMFLDIAGSTKAAQKIGDVEFHRYLNQLFILFDRPINRSGGEVHSYVGDAIIAIWPLSQSAENNSRVFAALREIHELCQLHSQTIRENFGVEPGVRAAIHGGSVVAGETGDSKRQITYLGDTVNITARIEGMAKELGEHYLVSDAILSRTVLPHGSAATPVGKHELKGVGEVMALSALSFDGDVAIHDSNQQASKSAAVE